MINSVPDFKFNVYDKVSYMQAKNNKPIGMNLSNQSDSISFKGHLTQKVTEQASKKSLKGLFAALAVALGVGTTSQVSKTIASPSPKNILEEYREKYSALMNYLDESGEWRGRDDDYWCGAYTDNAKIAVVKTYEKNPEQALALTKKLYFDRSSSYSEELLEAINYNYEELKKYNKNNLEDAYKKIGMIRINPKLENITLIPKIDSKNLAVYNNYCIDEESVQALEKALTDNRLSANEEPEDFIKMANLCKKYPDLPKAISNTIYCHGIIDKAIPIIEKYSNNWERLLEIINIIGINTAVEMRDYLDYPKHIKFAQENRPSDMTTEEYIEKLVMTENLLKEIESAGHKPVELNTFDELLCGEGSKDFALSSSDDSILNFIKNIDKDDIEYYRRMIKDNRCNLLEMQELLPLYKKYSDKKITNEMVARYKDPAARAMNLY